MNYWQEMLSKLGTVPFQPRKEDENLIHRYKGIPFIRTNPIEALEAMNTFEVRDDDLFLITYAKAGTTWTQEIVSMVLCGGNEDAIEKTHLLVRFPFLEMNWASHYSQCDQVPSVHTILDKVDSPRKIKTHLSGDFLPPQVYTKKPKIIYVARNPKDVAVSYFFMHKHVHIMPYYSVWDTFFADFMKGDVHAGSWYDHTLFWWKKRHEPNVLFLKYEDMKRNLRESTAKVAKFLGCELTSEALDATVRHCSFKSMKKNKNANPDFLRDFFAGPSDDTPEATVETVETNSEDASFLRKGVVGDWKNYFTVSQNEMFDAEYRARMEGSGLHFDFELPDDK